MAAPLPFRSSSPINDSLSISVCKEEWFLRYRLFSVETLIFIFSVPKTETLPNANYFLGIGYYGTVKFKKLAK